MKKLFFFLLLCAGITLMANSASALLPRGAPIVPHPVAPVQPIVSGD
jgi:hypothetical protein